MRYWQARIALIIMLAYSILTPLSALAALAAEPEDYILGDAWTVGQGMPQEEYTVSSSDDGLQLFYMTGTVYYEKAYEALALVNRERLAAGLDMLTMDEELLEAAMLRSAECSLFYGHTRPNGLACSSVSSKSFGENIAASTGMKFATAEAVVDAWMNSAGHRQNILSPGYQSIGIGCFYKDGVWYWAQAFGRAKAAPAVRKDDGRRTFALRALEQYVSPFLVVEHHNMEKGQQVQYFIKLRNMGWASANAYIEQNSYQWSSDARELSVNQMGVVTAENWGSGTITAVNLGSDVCCLTGTIDVYTDAVIDMAGEIYVQQCDRRGLVAGMPLTLSKTTDVEYSWYVAGEDGSWKCIQNWTENNEWLSWTPESYGSYRVAAWARVTGNPSSTAMKELSFDYCPQIKGKCQMPYSGEGGGYLIGIETYENPGQRYQYEMLILDCTLLAEGRDAWIYSTGRCRVNAGNALWTVWQPEYGYYWTLFRVFDEQGTMLDEACYGFQNT